MAGFIDDGYVPESAFVHEVKGVPERLVEADGLEVSGHDGADCGIGRVAVVGDRAKDDVAFGADSGENALVHDENGRGVPFLHDDCGITHGGAGVGGGEWSSFDDFTNKAVGHFRSFRFGLSQLQQKARTGTPPVSCSESG